MTLDVYNSEHYIYDDTPDLITYSGGASTLSFAPEWLTYFVYPSGKVKVEGQGYSNVSTVATNVMNNTAGGYLDALITCWGVTNSYGVGTGVSDVTVKTSLVDLEALTEFTGWLNSLRFINADDKVKCGCGKVVCSIMLIGDRLMTATCLSCGTFKVNRDSVFYDRVKNIIINGINSKVDMSKANPDAFDEDECFDTRIVGRNISKMHDDCIQMNDRIGRLEIGKMWMQGTKIIGNVKNIIKRSIY